jgi:hypothetical protein
MEVLVNNVNDTKMIIMIKPNPAMIVEIKIFPKLFTLTRDSHRLSGSLWHWSWFILGLLNFIKNRLGFPPKVH